MPRPLKNAPVLALPPEPDVEALNRYSTPQECANAHCKWYAPISDRTISETWPLRWLVINSRRVTLSRDFVAEAERRFAAAHEANPARVEENAA